ncbi:MAG: hypothetical protein H6710_13810 [Myxococcales bacterium]|nr:hypothetical protein [Myxococcales bacterium]MCB9704987.1 hypothetical protein [Myxococcales bacterium]
MRTITTIAVTTTALLVGACFESGGGESDGSASASASATAGDTTGMQGSAAAATGYDTDQGTGGGATDTGESADLSCEVGNPVDVEGKTICCFDGVKGDFAPVVVDLSVFVSLGDGAPPNVLYDSGSLFLESEGGVDRVAVGGTAAAAMKGGVHEVRVLAGTYRTIYEVDRAGTQMPINTRSVVGASVLVSDGSAEVDVDLKPVALGGALKIDENDPIIKLYDAGTLVLVDQETRSRTMIHHTNLDGGGAISARVLPGSYELHYAADTVQTVMPANGDAWIMDLVIPKVDTHDLGEVPLATLQIAAGIELDGGAPPDKLTDNAALFLVDDKTGDRIKVGETRDGALSPVRLLTGPGRTYSLYYAVLHSQGVPVNEWARLRAPFALEELGAMISIDGVTVSGTVSVDGIPLAPDPANSGQISLVSGDDRALLGSTKDGPFSRSVLASTYEVVYGHESSDGAIPANVRARVRETYDPVNEPNLPLSIATTLVEGAITINSMPPPDSLYASGTISLRGASGDQVVLARTHEGSFSRRVVAGTYDVIYAVDVPGAGVPRNAEAVLMKGVEIAGESYPLALNIDTVTIEPTITLPNAAAYERARFFLQPFDGDELIYVGATGDPSLGVEVLPGSYYLIYQADHGGVSLPANERAVIGCFKSP